MERIKVLDKGYVRLVQNMGSDLDVVNAARASFDRESSAMTEKDFKLIDFLIRDKHDSTLRHCAMTFEVYAPLMVARQWYKHAVASTHLDDQMGWNESSRRYITENEEFYIPLEWRSAAENRKQGSGEPVDFTVGAEYTQKLRKLTNEGYAAYKEALEAGIAPEQARLLLPAYGMYVRWRWTTSLNGLLHFLSLRLKEDSQYEIREYANAVLELTLPFYSESIKSWHIHRVGDNV
jgi:thymidylate synthase (FAD)